MQATESNNASDDIAVGVVSCLTCGNGKQREISPPRDMTRGGSIDDSTIMDKLSYTIGEDVILIYM
jgi:hypothetical protein